MRRLMVLAACVAALAGCKPVPDPGNEEAWTDNTVIEIPNLEDPLPPYVPAANEAEGDNAMSTATPGEDFYRDLPAARALRGDWTIRKSAWFAVNGSDTARPSPSRMRAFAGARVRIDRQKIVITPRNRTALAKVTLDCSGIGYLDKDRLVQSANSQGISLASREDLLIGASIAVAEREIARAFVESATIDGRVLAVICPLSDTGDGEAGEYPDAYLTGTLQIDVNKMALIMSDGTVLYAERDRQ